MSLVLARPREAVLHPLVHPQPPHQLTDLVRQLHLVPLRRHLEEEPRVLLQWQKSSVSDLLFDPLLATPKYLNLTCTVRL